MNHDPHPARPLVQQRYRNRLLGELVGIDDERAILCVFGNRASEGVAACERLLKQENPPVELYVYLAIGRLRLRQFEQAEAAAAQAIALEPGFAPAWHMRGRARGALGEFAEGLTDIRFAIGLYPRIPGAWHALYEVYSRMGRRDMALDALKQAVKISPCWREMRQLLDRELAEGDGDTDLTAPDY